MPSPVLRLWVLLLAVLLQVGSWHAEAHSSASIGAASPLVANDGAGDCEAPDDSTEELSAVDDTAGSDVVASSVPKWSKPPPDLRGYAWVDGLAPGGPPGDTPFKPPRG